MAVGAGLVLWTSFGNAGIEFSTGTIQGAVKTNGGAAVPSAVVRAIHEPEDGTSVFAPVDPMTGAYAFSLPAGSYRLVATYEQVPVGTPLDVTLAAQEIKTAQDFAFAAGTIGVHVMRNGANDVGASLQIAEVGPAGGCAAPAATCSVIDADNCKCVLGGRDYFCNQGVCVWSNNGVFTASSDAQGLAAKLVPAGTYAVRALSSSSNLGAPPMPPMPPMTMQSGAIEVGRTAAVVVADGAVAAGGDFTYETGQISGHVTAGGQPFTNASIRADAGFLGQVTAWVDGAGGYTLVLPSTTPYTITALLEGSSAIHSFTDVTVDPLAPLDLDFAVPGGFLRGIVTRDGTPVSGAQISVVESAPVSCAQGANCQNIDLKGCFCDLDGRKFGCDLAGHCFWFDGQSFLASTSFDGSFTRFVPPGDYGVAISSANEMATGMPPMPPMPPASMQSGSVIVRQLAATITDNATTDIGTINYVTGTVAGVLTSCGQPLQGSVQAQKTDFGGALSVFASLGGTYTLRAPQGTYDLSAQWQNQTFATLASANVVGGASVSFSAARDLGQLRGLVKRDGLPAGGVFVQIVESNPALTCATGSNCLTDPGKPGFCQCDVNGRKFFCDPQVGCRFFDTQLTTAFTGPDGFFTATVLPGAYEVVLFSNGQTDPKAPPMGGGGIRVGSAFANVNACALTELNIATDGVAVAGGANVTTDLGDGITLAFPTVAAGTASFTATSTPPPASAPQFSSVGLYYDFIVPAFSGTVEICLPYDGTQVPAGTPLAIFHDVAGQWVDITTRVDATNHVVCGNTSSFSFFTVGVPKTITPLVAKIVAPDHVSADAVCKGHVHLDGSTSTGATSYRWFTGDTQIGEGQTADVLLPLGTSTVKLLVSAGGTTQAAVTATIAVVDDTPPTVSVSVSPSVLWPPDGRLVTIVPTATSHDNCDASPKLSILGASSPTAAPSDIVVTQPASVSVRAFRAGTEKSGRTYTLRYQVTDSAGNRALSSATVFVPHDQGGQH